MRRYRRYRRRLRRARQRAQSVARKINNPIPVPRYVKTRFRSVSPGRISPRRIVRKSVNLIRGSRIRKPVVKIDDGYRSPRSLQSNRTSLISSARNTCKVRPSSTLAARRAKGTGTSRRYIPWCERRK